MKKITRTISVVVAVVLLALSLVALTACNSKAYLYSGYAQTKLDNKMFGLSTAVSVSGNKITNIEVTGKSQDGLSDTQKTEFEKAVNDAITEYKKQDVQTLLSWEVSYGANASTGASGESSSGTMSFADTVKTLLLDSMQNGLTAEVDEFRQQCNQANIASPAYEDPNAPIKVAEGTVAEGEADVVTGASGVGSDYYAGSGSYQTLEYALTRASLKYYHSITWTEAKEAKEGTTASTLEEAVKLSNAKYIREAFPNDGKNYSITMSGNAISTKTLVTKDAKGNITASVLGLGMTKIGNDYYVTGSLTTKKSLINLLETDTAILVVYEYNPTSPDKSGAGTRNFGCRLVLELDREQSTFINDKYASLGKIGDNKAMIEGSAGAMVKLKVTEMWTLG